MSDLEATPGGYSRIRAREARCECDRGDVIAAAFQRQTSLLVRRIEDMGYPSSPDWRCVDCIADMAMEVAAHPRRGWHPDFGGPGMTTPTSAPPEQLPRPSQETT